METIRGRMPHTLDLNDLHEQLANYQRITLDIGTGDGKFAFHHARAFPSHFVIGVDACRENLREFSRAKLSNLLFVIANAQSLPHEFNELVSHITINFPWGSLLESLLTSDLLLMHRLELISLSTTLIDVRLNGGALAEQGWTLEARASQIYDNLLQADWQMKTPVMLSAQALQDFPSTWAKRLAFGRDPRAIQLSGHI